MSTAPYHRLLSALFTDGEGINLRAFSDDSTERKPRSGIYSSIDDAVAAVERAMKLPGYGIFYGVNPRVPNADDGTAANVAECRVLWVDLDQEPSSLLSSFPQPSIVVTSSPGKQHLLWKLKEPVSPDESVTLNKLLAAALGGDPRATDIARVLRMPGTLHQKSTPVEVTLDFCDPKREYNACDFAQILDDLCVQTAAESTTSDYSPIPASRQYGLDALQRAHSIVASSPAGSRNSTLFKESFLIGTYAETTQLTDDEITKSLMAAAVTCGAIADDGHAKCADSVKRGIAAGRQHPRAARAENPVVTRPFTDTGNAERLVDRHGHEIRYCHPWKKWHTWRDIQWSTDETGDVASRIKDTLRAARQSAMNRLRSIPTPPADAPKDHPDRLARAEIQDELKFLSASESSRARSSMETLARSEAGVPILIADMNKNPWLLNVLNGTIDLRTGDIRPHDPSDLITRCAPVVFDREARCPVWRSVIARCIPDIEVQQFLQRAVGYALTGVIAEHGFFFLYGRGANGKSTILNTILKLLGDYARTVPVEMFIEAQGDRHPTEIADLHGVRFAVTSEAPLGKSFDESKLKKLTGGDRLEGRRMREDFRQFDPTHKLFISGNHRPRIKGQDDGIWRRVYLIPFNVQIPTAEQNPELPTSLAAELPGILNWAIAGCMAWKALGLTPPSSVQAASDDYRQSQDALADFFDSCCDICPQDADPAVRAQYRQNWPEFFRAYNDFCDRNKEKPLGKIILLEHMADRGFPKRKLGVLGSKTQEKAFFLIGIRLRTSQTPQGQF